MSTGASCAEVPGLPAQAGPAPPGPLRTLGVLARFRWRTLPGRVRVLVALAGPLATGLAVCVVVGAHRLPPEATTSLARDGLTPEVVAATLPVTFVAFLLSAVAAAVGAGGGRETLPSDQAVALPLGSRVDHLAALGWAPLSLAWLAPATALLASVSFVARTHVVAAEVVVVLWLLAATAVAQALAWAGEVVRGTPRGLLVVRAAVVTAVAALAWTIWAGRTAAAAHVLGGDVLAGLVRAGDADDRPAWVLGVLGLGALLVVAVRLGDRAAAAAARRPPRAQADLETRRHPLRPARTLEGALRRLDRAGVWRSTPLRRGLALLALLPVVLAVSGRVEWGSLPLLPGFFGLGGALLFGVNALSLDAAGAWWRESLPVAPETLFRVRTRIVLEVLLLPSVATLVVGAVRAGPPPGPAAVLAAVGATTVVVARVLASVMRWSVIRPYAVDLRRPRATPAPAGAMLAYSVRLSLHGTLYGAVFTGLAALSTRFAWALPVTAATTVLLLLPSVLSLRRTRLLWLDPVLRAGVVRTVGAV